MHLVRSNHTKDQVFDYPHYVNLPILKVIQDELRQELEVKDDIEAKNLNSKFADLSKVRMLII